MQVGKLPADLLDRRVEITGPVDRKMVINALNSGASVFMADFEDSNAPTWYAILYTYMQYGILLSNCGREWTEGRTSGVFSYAWQ